jgi:hypothetical protein
MIDIYDSCDDKILTSGTPKEPNSQIFYAFLSIDGQPKAVLNKVFDPPSPEPFVQLRKIDFNNGDLYQRTTDVKPMINLFEWIAHINGINATGEDAKLIGMSLVKSKKAKIYPNIIKSKYIGTWKYKNKKLKM